MYNATGNTIREDWRGADRMIDPSSKNYRSPEVIREGRVMENFRLIDGIAPPMGLRWEMINLFHDRNVAAKDLRGPKISPHAGVIAVGIHHPRLVRAVGRDDVPNLAQVKAELSYLNRLAERREANVASLKRLKEARDALLHGSGGEVARGSISRSS
jgi:hypothetical protein